MGLPERDLYIGKLAKTHTSAGEFYIICHEITGKRNLM